MTEDIATPSKIWIITGESDLQKRPPALEVAVIPGDISVNRKDRPKLRPPKEVKWMCPN